MSRSGYSDDCDGWALIRWRGAVESAIRGQRGQTLLRELVEALDAMPVKELIAHELEADGSYCALGVVGKKRGIAIAEIDPEDAEAVAAKFDIASALAKEIVFINDEEGSYLYWAGQETPAARWMRVRAWAASQIKTQPTKDVSNAGGTK
jgi:hypothetical protein